MLNYIKKDDGVVYGAGGKVETDVWLVCIIVILNLYNQKEKQSFDSSFGWLVFYNRKNSWDSTVITILKLLPE